MNQMFQCGCQNGQFMKPKALILEMGVWWVLERLIWMARHLCFVSFRSYKKGLLGVFSLCLLWLWDVLLYYAHFCLEQEMNIWKNCRDEHQGKFWHRRIFNNPSILKCLVSEMPEINGTEVAESSYCSSWRWSWWRDQVVITWIQKFHQWSTTSYTPVN